MNIVIYSKPNCPWCVKAKELMNKLHLKYDEKILDVDYTRDELKQLVPENLPLTVPQIFVYNKRIGGYEDFVEYCDNHNLTER
jgi:glutaredoxin